MNNKELLGKMLEGLCEITVELFDERIKNGNMDIKDEVGVPLDFLKNAWVAKQIEEHTRIDFDTLSEIANGGEQDVKD